MTEFKSWHGRYQGSQEFQAGIYLSIAGDIQVKSMLHSGEDSAGGRHLLQIKAVIRGFISQVIGQNTHKYTWQSFQDIS